jgi:hypothetical protein
MLESLGSSTVAVPLIAAGRPTPYSTVGIPINRPSRESVLQRLSEALLRQSLTKVCCLTLRYLVSRPVTSCYATLRYIATGDSALAELPVFSSCV